MIEQDIFHTFEDYYSVSRNEGKKDVRMMDNIEYDDNFYLRMSFQQKSVRSENKQYEFQNYLKAFKMFKPDIPGYFSNKALGTVPVNPPINAFAPAKCTIATESTCAEPDAFTLNCTLNCRNADSSFPIKTLGPAVPVGTLNQNAIVQALVSPIVKSDEVTDSHWLFDPTNCRALLTLPVAERGLLLAVRLLFRPLLSTAVTLPEATVSFIGQ